MDAKWLIVVLLVGFAAGVWYEKGQQFGVQSSPVPVTGAAIGLPSDFKAKLNVFVKIPNDALIAKIDDINKVRAQQPQFYENAKNGDYMIAFGDTVVIYDYQNNKIMDKFKVVT